MPKRILIVDDKEEARYFLKILLEKSAYAVETACDGEEALAIARKNPPDMIISDILMPVMDGFNLCREWRKDKRLCGLPFIFYTATYTDQHDEDFALKIGADKFIVKPAEPSDLLAIIAEMMAGAKRKSASGAVPEPVLSEIYFKQYSEGLARKLEDKLELFRVIFNTDSGIIFLLSPSHHVLEINRAACEFLGMRAPKIIGISFTDRFVAQADQPDFTRQLNKAVSGFAIRDIESSIHISDGSKRLLRWNAGPVARASGALEGVLLIGTDITDARRAEQERRELETQLRRAQRMEAIGIFAGGIAHDFNNILTGIFGFIEIVQHELPPDSHSAETLHSALVAANRAKALVGQILSIARRSEGPLQQVDVAKIAGEVGKLLRASIPPQIDIALNIDSDTGTVMAEPIQIHQVLMNLCTNAYQAIGQTGGTIGISCRSQSEEGSHDAALSLLPAKEYVLIEISDTGCGMNKTTMERMFDPYFTTKESGMGTGLGLSVVKAIVEAHQGRITCESQEGKGSTFRVYLPKSTTIAPVAQKQCGCSWEPGNKQMILCVEDDESIGPMLDQALQKLGYQSVLARNGKEAMNLFLEKPQSFDLILTDLNMPHIGGIELAQKILSLRPTMPIVLMSGITDILTEHDVRSRGIRVCLRKPFSIEELSRALKEVAV
jgi:PAS domain S-box-containing protein